MQYFFIEATTWARRYSKSSTRSENPIRMVSQDELQMLGSPDALELKHLKALGFTTDLYEAVRVLKADGEPPCTAHVVASWDVRTFRWPWGRRLRFRQVPLNAPFLIGTSRLRPI